MVAQNIPAEMYPFYEHKTIERFPRCTTYPTSKHHPIEFVFLHDFPRKRKHLYSAVNSVYSTMLRYFVLIFHRHENFFARFNTLAQMALFGKLIVHL